MEQGVLTASPYLSVVVPVKNEEGNVEPLLQELQQVLAKMDRPYEIVYVDDGSTDKTLQVLLKRQKKIPQLRVIKFDRNYGQTAALDAGIRNARGEVVVTLDGDLQNDPADLPTLVAALESCDLAIGYRAKRHDTRVRKISSRIANNFRNWATHDNTIDTGCTLKAFRRRCLERIKLYEGMHRFLPLLFKMEGFAVRQFPVNHRPRRHGKAKYGIGNRVWKGLKDLMAVRWMQRRCLKYRIEKEF
ncbi:MAG: glycosyltransferase family 2 protein [bacterium]